MAGAKSIMNQRGNGRQLHHRLRDPAARVGEQSVAQPVELGPSDIRADDDTLAARAIHRLDHQFAKAVEDFSERATGSSRRQVSTLGRIGSSPR